jgi:predicted NUDIX family NTP pyrophosphohydrolase
MGAGRVHVRGRGRVSAGILLYRWRGGSLEVLLGHPGGPYFRNKGDGHWSIPKGEVDDGEDGTDAGLRAVARREFEEETGSPVPGSVDALLPLGEIIQKGGKRVVAWAVEGDLDPATAVSNLFRVEWPPRSGRYEEVPEIDEVAWLTPAQARQRIKPTQTPFVDRLEAALGERLA